MHDVEISRLVFYLNQNLVKSYIEPAFSSHSDKRTRHAQNKCTFQCASLFAAETQRNDKKQRGERCASMRNDENTIGGGVCFETMTAPP
jgi:hypothetical protein